jgi:hypothetical protein
MSAALACAGRGSSCAEDHFALILGAFGFCDAVPVGFATIPLLSLKSADDVAISSGLLPGWIAALRVPSAAFASAVASRVV